MTEDMTAFKLELLFFTALLGSVKTRYVDTTDVSNVLTGEDDTVTDDMCQDCTEIFTLLKDLVSNKEFQAKLTDSLEQVCDNLPIQVRQICHIEVEKILPLAITFIAHLTNPSDICVFLGLCGGRDSGTIRDLLLNHIEKNIPLQNMEVETSIQCSVCTYVVSTLAYLFPRERTQNIITILLESLCKEFPPLVQPVCNRLIEKYVQLLVDMLVNSTSPNFICTLLRLCDIWEDPVSAAQPLSDCDSCLTLVVLTRMHLGSNATEHQAALFLNTICQLHPNTFPKCDPYVQHHWNQLSEFLGKQQGALDICKRTNQCVSGEPVPVNTADPCSVAPAYRCKDLQTAVDCGAVAFCQKNVWG